jgi:hypothetical protein
MKKNLEDAQEIVETVEGLTNDLTSPFATLSQEEAIRLINEQIPEAIREDVGGFERAFGVLFTDGRRVLFAVLERGYFIHFSRPDTNSKGGFYLSPEAAFALGMFMSLFIDDERDEKAFWEKLDPEQRKGLLAIFRHDSRECTDTAFIDGICTGCGTPEAEHAGKPPHIPQAEADAIAAEVAAESPTVRGVSMVDAIRIERALFGDETADGADMIAPGDAKCGFCGGDMPCDCKDPLTPEEREAEAERDAEIRNGTDLGRG